MKIAIIGAGFTGLSAAFDRAKAGDQVTIFEGQPFAGGLASGFKEDHWEWSAEKFYHHWFESDQAMLGLIDEMGVRDRVIFPRPYTVMYHNGQFYPMDSIINAIKFPGLGWGLDKLRFGLTGLYLRLATNWKSLEKVTVAEWMKKWAGERTYRLMWEPLMIGKFGEKYADQVNMAWMWARLHARTTRLGTYKGGFQAFCDELVRQLETMGVKVQFNTSVAEIQPNEGGGISLTAGGQRLAFDQVLLTCSPGAAARLAPTLPDDYLNDLLQLKSLGALVMTISLDKQLSKDGYYWYNIPKNAGFPFLAIVEHTNYVSPDFFGGDHIVYIGDYLELSHPHFRMELEEIKKLYLPHLKKINPNFDESWVKKAWLHKAEYAQPVPLLNHSKNIPSIRTPIKNLFFASMSHVYPWDRGTNFAVELGRNTAKLMLEDRSQ